MDLMTVIAGVAAGNALTASFIYWCFQAVKAEREGRDLADLGFWVNFAGAAPGIIVAICAYNIPS